MDDNNAVENATDLVPQHLKAMLHDNSAEKEKLAGREQKQVVGSQPKLVHCSDVYFSRKKQLYDLIDTEQTRDLKSRDLPVVTHIHIEFSVSYKIFSLEKESFLVLEMEPNRVDTSSNCRIHQQSAPVLLRWSQISFDFLILLY